MKLFYITISCILISFAPAREKPASIDDLKWLAGEWRMQRKNGILIEKWELSEGGTLKGASFFISHSGERKALESIWIKYEDGHYWYIPTVPDQNENKPVTFRITRHGPHGFVAENPEHDYPRRITYELVDTDSIHAWTDDGRDPPGKRSDFYYSRLKS